MENVNDRLGLSFRYAWTADDPLLTEFYSAYDRCFVIDSEKEELQGFKDCLSLNGGSSYKVLESIYGPYREFILLAYDERNQVIGGANFICLLMGNLHIDSIATSSINLNYIFILPEHRGKNYFRTIIEACTLLALQTVSKFGGTNVAIKPPSIFFEQNDPIRMSISEYEMDSHGSGLDQIQRLLIWAKVGAKVIDVPYVQPALSSNQEDNDSLLYCLIDKSVNTSLSPCYLYSHLERFFRISVLKNSMETGSNSSAKKLLDLIEGYCKSGQDIRVGYAGDWALQAMPLGKRVIGIAHDLRELIFSKSGENTYIQSNNEL